MIELNHDYYMGLALKQAEEAANNDEVPIGAVIVHEGKVIALSRNNRVETNKTASHAEMIAIEQANEVLDSWRLDTCTMYVTIEPCPMCAGAIIQSRIKNLVYGAKDPKAGAHSSVVDLFEQSFNHKVNIINGVREKECSEIMTNFFKEIRSRNK